MSVKKLAEETMEELNMMNTAQTKNTWIANFEEGEETKHVLFSMIEVGRKVLGDEEREVIV